MGVLQCELWFPHEVSPKFGDDFEIELSTRPGRMERLLLSRRYSPSYG